MSIEAVKQIIGRALVEPAFRKQLFTDADGALKGYDLSEQELALLKDLPEESFESAAGELSARISRAGIIVKSDPAPFPHHPTDLK